MANTLTKEQRTEQAKKAWITIRERKAGGLPPKCQEKKTTSKDEQLERLRGLMRSWFSNEPFPVQESISDAAADVSAEVLTVETVGTITDGVVVTVEVPAVTPEVVVEPKKSRRKKAEPVVSIDATEVVPADAPTVDLLDAIVDAQQPEAPKGRRKKAA